LVGATNFRWKTLDNVNIPSDLLEVCGGNQIIASAMKRRGIITKSQAMAFLDPTKYNPASPYEFSDMEKAVSRILKAINKVETIGVWGDFDVDGQTATTLLVESLTKLGAESRFHIPVRGPESHGITLPVLKVFLDSGIDLLLTCDTGISGADAVDFCNQRNVDVIITDHHSLPDILPKAHAIINPRMLPRIHPLGNLAGVATAFQLAKALFDFSKRNSETVYLLDLVALGTIADLADLRSDGRYLAQSGLYMLRKTERLGIRTLLEITETNLSCLDEDHISYIIAPRLNAIGRLSDANQMVEFLTTKDPALANIYAQQIEAFNSQRKILVDQVFKAALLQLENDQQMDQSPVIFLSHPTWPASIVGIVASRLVEQYHKPAILFSAPDGGKAAGSARSVEGLDIISFISENHELLSSFGGHPMAAGLSLDTEKLPLLKKRIEKTVLSLVSKSQVEHELQIDAKLPFSGLSIDLAEQINRLAPFGPGNPPLVLSTHGVMIQNVTEIGRTKEHLQLIVEDAEGDQRRILFWNGTDYQLPEGRFDLAYSIRTSDFKGKNELTLEWVDSRQDESQFIKIDDRLKIKLVDLRSIPNPESEINKLAIQPGVTIFQEGIINGHLLGKNRIEIGPTKHLVIETPPPSLSILKEIIFRSNPQTITFCAIDTRPDILESFLASLMGLIRFAINKKAGQLDIQRISARLSQNPITVQRGMDLLAEKGIISLDEGKVIESEIKMPENKVTDSRIEVELKGLLEETAAFREYYKRAAPEDLVAVELLGSRKFKGKNQ
jgi:single-stranded-DNA-specific exonuclease